MGKKKRKRKRSQKDRIIAQKTLEALRWQKTAEMTSHANYAIAYYADTMLEELLRVYREVQP